MCLPLQLYNTHLVVYIWQRFYDCLVAGLSYFFWMQIKNKDVSDETSPFSAMLFNDFW